MSRIWTPLTIFYQDLPIRRCTENDISIDNKIMALVAEIRKTPGLIHNPTTQL